MTNNGNAASEIVPFGKYKGQPAEILIADTDYCDWLTAQPWFRDRFSNIYNLVINYGTEPQDSPEHNQMQAKFLDDRWCVAVGEPLFPHGLYTTDVSWRTFEDGGWDVSFRVKAAYEGTSYEDGIWKSNGKWEGVPQGVMVECKPDLGDDYPAVLRQVKNYRSGLSGNKRCVVVRRHAFEHVTWDQVRRIFAASDITLLAESEIGRPE